jgi:hypothetical protein
VQATNLRPKPIGDINPQSELLREGLELRKDDRSANTPLRLSSATERRKPTPGGGEGAWTPSPLRRQAGLMLQKSWS